jgi:hypothetical protein
LISVEGPQIQALSVLTLQTCAGAGPAVADVPSAIAAAKHTDAQAKAKELIMFLTNFVFMIVSFYFLFLFWPSVTSRCAAFARAPACEGEVISGRSPMYRTETSARLCGKWLRHVKSPARESLRS